MTEKISPFFLRITATPKCNLKCEYCNPNETFGDEITSDQDLIETAKAANELGIKTAHWTERGSQLTKKMDTLNISF